MMKVNKIRSKIISQLDTHLGIGIALCEWDILISVYENELFSSWFPLNDDYNNLANRIPDLNTERLKKRLSKGHDYSLEHEIKEGNRKKVLKLTFSKVSELQASMILIKAIDYTKEKELEYMIDSYAKIAERNKRDLEKAYKKIKAQNNQMLSELEMARQVQMGMLPLIFPAFPKHKEFDIYARLLPAKELGGDLYDFFFIDDTHLCIAIGDVSGKGVPASLLMAVTITLLRTKAVRGIRSDELVNRIDKDLRASYESRMFVTFFLGIVDLSTGELDYTSSGHNPPYLIRSDGAIEKMIVNPGLPLGTGVQKKYSSRKVNIKPSETLVLFTDGVTEAMNVEEVMFEEEKTGGCFEESCIF